MTTSRTVLVVDYFFPPMASSAVRRTVGFVRHLAHFGWLPVVLTAESGLYHSYDPALLETIPHTVRVQRTASLEPVRFAKRLLRRSPEPGRCPDVGNGKSAVPRSGPRWLSEARRWVFFPDPQLGWFPFAVARGMSLIRRQRIDVIYSSSPANCMTSHLVGYSLKKLLGRPWVADFQDPWSPENRYSFVLHKMLGKRIEHAILREADRVTLTTEAVRSMLARKYTTVPPGNFVVVPSGFECADFQNVEPIPRRKFTITHFGGFYDERSPGAFLEALAGAIAEHSDLAQDVEVMLFGMFDRDMTRATRVWLDRYHLNDVVRLEGVVPYRVGVQHLKGSHVLLLVTFTGEPMRHTVPAKLFDYLGTGRPILALAAPDGETRRIVEAAKAGVVVDPTNVRAIKDAIVDLYRRWQAGDLVGRLDRGIAKDYTWGELTRKLAATLEDTLALAR